MIKYNLQNRLIKFSVSIINLCEGIRKNNAGIYLSNQLIRSGISPALNYGEAQATESKKDFIHKMKLVLKELRESFVSLKIIDQAKLHNETPELERAKSECNELIAIFVTSLKTSQRTSQI